jgi:rRNA maturation RNase YbeY
MISVNFFSKPKFAYPRRKFLKLVKSICKRFRVSNAAVNILMTDNRQIRALNKKFHHCDAVTDCLSFDLSEKPGFPHFTSEKKISVSSASSPAPAGRKQGAASPAPASFKQGAVKRTSEIIVNAQKAKSESKKRGHSPQAELALYITHALLHNLGFNDNNPKNAKLMHQMEDKILQKQGFGIVYNSHRASGF